MELKDLSQTGLNEKEVKIYLSLLRGGVSTVSAISKETGINRSLLYFILDKLEKEGVVSYVIKNNVRYYQPIEPERILDRLKQKELGFKRLLPELLALKNSSLKKPKVEILEGKEGIKTILSEILRLKCEWYAFNVPGKGPEIMGDYVYSWEKERQKHKILLNVLMVSTKQGLVRGKEFEKMKYTKVKYLGESYSSPASNYIYGDRIAILFWYKEYPFAIRIIDKNLADSYKNYFNLLWKLAKK